MNALGIHTGKRVTSARSRAFWRPAQHRKTQNEASRTDRSRCERSRRGEERGEEDRRRGAAGIVNAAKKGEEVNLAGFGKFKVKDSPARQGRNPATGEAIEIAASRKLGFTPAKQVKDALAG